MSSEITPKYRDKYTQDYTTRPGPQGPGSPQLPQDPVEKN